MCTPRELVVRLLIAEAWDRRAADAVVRAALAADIHDEFTVTPVFDRAVSEQLDALVAQRRAPGYRPPSFGRAFHVSLPRGVAMSVIERARALLERADRVQSVEIAWPLRGAAVLPRNDTNWKNQGYAHGALSGWRHVDAGDGYSEDVIGTNAWYLWRFPGGDGRGVEFADVEAGWRTTHPDLAGLPFVVTGPESSPRDAADGTVTDDRHGTNTLGVVCAADNAQHVVGIAPAVAPVRLVSYVGEWDAEPDQSDPLAERLERAIQLATLGLGPGDVMLLEVEVVVAGSQGKPVESLSTVLDAIEQAGALDRIVIEPAANGTADIADFLGLDADGAARDSGAIVVGAGSGLTQRRTGGTNRGPRIDCWSWGGLVATTDIAADGSLDVGNYSGTSSAAAIIAGLALGLQGAYKAHRTTRPPEDPPVAPYLDPAAMRELLKSHGEDGLTQDGASVAAIGRQPDIRRIIDLELQLPFPWVRDWRLDAGEPGVELRNACPDLALREVGVPFGDPPFEDDDLAVGDTAELHIRVHNRAARPAGGVTLDVHGSVPTLAPATWLRRRLGEFVVEHVPAFGHADHRGALEGILPIAAGNAALEVVVRHDPADPRLHHARILSAPHVGWMEHVRSIARRHRIQVAYRPRPHPLLSPRAQRLEFAVPGFERGHDRHAQVVLESRLPPGAALFLEFPTELAEQAIGDALARLASEFEEVQDGRATVRVQPNVRVSLPVFSIQPQNDVRLAWHVVLPPESGTSYLRARLLGERAFGRGVRWTIRAGGSPGGIVA